MGGSKSGHSALKNNIQVKIDPEGMLCEKGQDKYDRRQDGLLGITAMKPDVPRSSRVRLYEKARPFFNFFNDSLQKENMETYSKFVFNHERIFWTVSVATQISDKMEWRKGLH